MATFHDLPTELLSIIAADPDLTNHDRKQARLVCSRLADAITPFTFRRAYVSWIKSDRDAFLSLANTPHLAAHVEEVIWFQPGGQRNMRSLRDFCLQFAECDKHDLQNFSNELEGLTELRADLLTSAQGLCWPPTARPLEQFEWRNDRNVLNITRLNPAEYAVEFSAKFRLAIALMPKVHTLSLEPMPWRRVISAHPDSYPFHAGLMKTHAAYRKSAFEVSEIFPVFFDTINAEKGRITRLRCADQMSSSNVRGAWDHEPAFKYLTSFEYSISSTYPSYEIMDRTFFSRNLFVHMLRRALFQASQLQELSISWDCGAEAMRTRKPRTIWGLFLEDSGEAHRWQHLRSLKLGYVALKPTGTSFLSVIEAHVGSLRHLHLEQCRPAKSFARELSEISGLQLSSITISDSEIPKAGLISEQELLRFIHHGDTEDKKQARKIARGKFVTDNRRPDNDVDDEPFEDYDSDSDHSSEWWSDSDSDSGLEAISASNIIPPDNHRRRSRPW